MRAGAPTSATRLRPRTSGRSSTELIGSRWLLAAPAIAIAGTLAAHAGFSERGQVAFIALAGAAALAVAALDPDGLRLGLRQPVVIVLAAMALLAGASAAWTIASPAAAARWGLVLAGYAAVAAAGFAAARRCGAEAIAGLVVALAVVAGLIGLVGAAVHELPFAERIGGAWRPGGPFEYAPALAALELAAAPAAFRLLGSPGRRSAVGAGALAIAASVVALVSSRVILLLAALMLIAVVAWPSRTVGAGRALAIAAVAFAVSAGAAADALAGSYADPYVETADLPRVAGLALLLAVAVGLWLWVRGRFDRGGLELRRPRGPVVAVVLCVLVASTAAAALTPDSGSAVEPDAGLTHGRVELWGDAVQTAVERPALGYGALTFQVASTPEQGPGASRFAHNLVLEAWVELGIGGLALSVAVLALTVALAFRCRGTTAGWLLGPGAIAYVSAALVDWPWHVPASAATFALIVGALSAAAVISGREPGSAGPASARPAAF